MKTKAILSTVLRVFLYAGTPQKPAACAKGFAAKSPEYQAPAAQYRWRVVPWRIFSSWSASPDDLAQQPLGFLLQRQDIGADLLQCAQRLRLVEVAREADFVASPDAGRVVPGVGCVRQHLAAQEGFDAALFEQRNLLGISQVAVGLVFDHALLAADGGGEQAAQRVGVGLGLAGLVDLLDDGRGGLIDLPLGLEGLDLLRAVGLFRVDAIQAQRALDGDFPVAEGGVGEDLRLLGLLERKEGVADAGDVLVGQFAILLAQVFAQRLESLRGVDELHLAFSMRRLAIAEHPDISGDAGVVEHIERQGNDGLQPVALDDPAADVALALAGVAGEER